ncbi:hypothetical protein V1511DRAFT_294830 [Dipodascopsis uninucleata]
MSLYKPATGTSSNNKKKNISVSTSSVLGLSNELTLLKEKFENEKKSVGKSKKSISGSLRGDGKKSSWKQSNKGVEARIAQDLADNSTKSKEKTDNDVTESLRWKAEQYKAVKRGKRTGIRSQDVVLDVDLMSVDSSQSSSQSDEDDLDDEDGDLIEYTDEFGRTRMVTRWAYQELTADEHTDVGIPRVVRPDVLIYGDKIQTEAFQGNEEAMREIMERDYDKDLAAHYDSSKEIRTKGVGFYDFSKDEDVRKQEMEDLKNMRLETEKNLLKSRELHTRWLQDRHQRAEMLQSMRTQKQAEIFLSNLASRR